MPAKKKLLFGTNLKMYKTAAMTCQYIEEVIKTAKELSINEDDIMLFVIPSFTAIADASRMKRPSNLKIGAQNMCWMDQGEFTGEVSSIMLKEFNVDIVEIAHSERRRIFNEYDEMANNKVKAALSSGFIALLCIGDTAVQKKYNIMLETLRIQLKVGLHEITEGQAKNLWIAYEPAWAIGVNGVPASEECILTMHRVIRETIVELFPENGKGIPILFGGSVNKDNAEGILALENVDGLFVGRSAWNIETLGIILKKIMPVWKNKIG